VTFKELVKLMVEHDLELARRERLVAEQEGKELNTKRCGAF
jgi:hypothetical protein